MSFAGLYEKGLSKYNLGGDVPWRWGNREMYESSGNVHVVK
jgi:hypothetical protein